MAVRSRQSTEPASGPRASPGPSRTPRSYAVAREADSTPDPSGETRALGRPRRIASRNSCASSASPTPSAADRRARTVGPRPVDAAVPTRSPPVAVAGVHPQGQRRLQPGLADRHHVEVLPPGPRPGPGPARPPARNVVRATAPDAGSARSRRGTWSTPRPRPSCRHAVEGLDERRPCRVRPQLQLLMNGGTASSDPRPPPPADRRIRREPRISTCVAKYCALPSIAPSPAVNASSSQRAPTESTRFEPEVLVVERVRQLVRQDEPFGLVEVGVADVDELPVGRVVVARRPDRSGTRGARPGCSRRRGSRRSWPMLRTGARRSRPGTSCRSSS